MINIKQKDIDRFWGHVDKEKSTIFYNGTRCWEWIAFCNQYGYGRIGMGQMLYLAHRVSYEIKFGKIQNSIHILHHCDNPPCVNPDHLFAGTQQNNIDDMMQKGRNGYGGVRGESHGMSKLSDAQVAEIRRRYGFGGVGGESSLALAKEFGVTKNNILYIVKYKTRT